MKITKLLLVLLTGSIYGFMLYDPNICNAQSYPQSTATPLTTDLSMNQYKLMNVGDIITKGPWVDVRAFGAVGDGITNDTSSIQNAINSLPASGGTLLFPPGTYRASVSVRRSNIVIMGSGSAVTTIKIPDSGLNTPIVLELGDTASGNNATPYEKIVVQGLTLDGNRSGTPAPPNDLTGWGLALTKITYGRFSDMRAINCWNGGVGVFIDSNYNTGNGIYVYNCGNSFQGTPGFDMNSSKYCSFTGIVSEGCQYGARILDNCWDNIVEIIVKNAIDHGFVYDNQLVNQSYNNIILATVDGGVNYWGFLVGANCRNSVIITSISNVSGSGIQLANQVSATNDPTGNIINVTTRNNGGIGAKIDGDGNDVTVNSYLDGRTGAQGSNFAIDVSGNYNKIEATVTDSSPWQVRGIAIRSGATENEIVSYNYINTADPYNNTGTKTKFKPSDGKGDDIASSSTISIPLKGSFFVVTGTTGITTINASYAGRVITLKFNSSLTLYDGSNLELSGNFAATTDDTITLVCDGTNWYQISRSAN